MDPETGEPLTMSVTATEVRDELGQVTAIVSVMHDLTKLRELERRTLEQQLFESEKLAAIGRLAASIGARDQQPARGDQERALPARHRTSRGRSERASSSRSPAARPSASRASCARCSASTAPGREGADRRQPACSRSRWPCSTGTCASAASPSSTQLDPTLPPVLASADQLKQVFLNLLLNAQRGDARGRHHLRLDAPLARDATRSS